MPARAESPAHPAGRPTDRARDLSLAPLAPPYRTLRAALLQLSMERGIRCANPRGCVRSVPIFGVAASRQSPDQAATVPAA